jgi:hypothetical protein
MFNSNLGITFLALLNIQQNQNFYRTVIKILAIFYKWDNFHIKLLSIRLIQNFPKINSKNL